MIDELVISSGFVPIEILYDHWSGEVTRNVPAMLSLAFGSQSVAFHILQAEDMFYEEMCPGGAFPLRCFELT